MTVDTSTPTYTPFGFEINQQMRALLPHWHSPDTGGELAWNDIDLAKRYNEFIKLLKAAKIGGEHIHYLKTPVLPSRGFNKHHHTSFADGGAIFGAGIHTHLGNLDGGYAFAVYHPGTTIPLLPFEVEEPYSS
jgi:hypothetical protein